MNYKKNYQIITITFHKITEIFIKKLLGSNPRLQKRKE